MSAIFDRHTISGAPTFFLKSESDLREKHRVFTMINLISWILSGKIYSSDFSQTTVSRFEALNLSFKNMVNLKPFMEKWINDAERHKTLVEQDTDGLSLEDQKTLEIFQSSKDNLGHRRRKRRTCIDVKTKKALEQFYNGTILNM